MASLSLGGFTPPRSPRLKRAHHEESITVEIDGKWWNIPSVVNGKKMRQREAADYAIKNRKHLGIFKSLEEAVAAARSRSNAASIIPPKKPKF